jgi:UDP:flavonoid glycosyltransferase YjiC (YdhE family)
MTALDNGVPTIVAGTGQDKVVTNNLVEYTGVGINLRSKTPSVESIREAVDKVLDDGKYKFNAAVRMSKKFEEYDVGSVFDGVIQEEVRKWVERNRKEQVLCGTTVGVPSLL